MIDPADHSTKPLPQPTWMRFAYEGRIYTIALTQDLLEDWTVAQSWGGKANQLGGGKITPVASFEEGLKLLESIVRTRARRGYKQ